MDGAYLRSVLKYVIIAFISVLLIVYFFYHAKAALGEHPVTTVIKSETAKDIAEVSGYLFLDEIKLEAETDYVSMIPAVGDGETVCADQKLCDVYMYDCSETAEKIKALREQIEYLNGCESIKGGTLDTGSYDKPQQEAYDRLVSATAAGNYVLSRKYASEWFEARSKRSIYVKSLSGYDKITDRLLSELSGLLGGLTGGSEILSELAGRYYSTPDGFEDYFDYSAVSEGYDAVDGIIGRLGQIKNEAAAAKDRSAVGKIIPLSKWYYVCPDSSGLSEKLISGREYSLLFYENSGVSVMMTYEKALTAFGKELEYLVFSCAEIPSGFSLIRYQHAQMTVSEFSGLCIPCSSIRYYDGSIGVYIIDNNKARFRRLDVLSEKAINGVYVSSSKPDNKVLSEGEIPYLTLYDTVILSGKNIYEGKYIGVSS